jgi:PEP-CTERM motif-containing protein
MRRFLALASVTIGAFVGLAPTDAHAVTYNFDTNVVDVTAGVTNATVFGDTMDGLSVTVFFSAGGQETRAWADTGPGAGGASSVAWSLTLTGDTFGATWNYAGREINRLLLSGIGTGTVFDIDAGLADTPGSGGGIAWACIALGPPACQDAIVTYRNRVAVGASAPQGDLWDVVDVSFNAPVSNFGFIQDTDNDFATTSPVPEPGTLLLLGAGVSSLALRRRRSS